MQSNEKRKGTRFLFFFLPSFDFSPLKAKAKDSLLAWCEQIASCRDFIRVIVTERRKARASSTNSNKLFSLLFLKLLDFRSLKRNISSEGHDSKESKKQWAHHQVKKTSLLKQMDLTKRIWRNLLITLHGQALANCPNLHQPVPQAGPNHQSAIIYIDVMRCWTRKDAYTNYQTQRKEPDSTFYSAKSKSCHKNIAHLLAPWTCAPRHAFRTSVPPIVETTFGFHIEELRNPSIKTKQ